MHERMRIESVWLAYGENWVVRDVSLPVRQGEVLALIGASGSGKTTLLRSLNRLTEITAGAARAGRITLDGQDIHELEVNELRRKRVDGLPAAEPVPDEHLRQRRLRARRAAPRAAGGAGARRSSSAPSTTPCAGPASTRRSPATSSRSALKLSGRPAAAAVHRPRARRRTGGAAAGRAVLGARPDLDRDDRGADRRRCARASRS